MGTAKWQLWSLSYRFLAGRNGIIFANNNFDLIWFDFKNYIITFTDIYYMRIKFIIFIFALNLIFLFKIIFMFLVGFDALILKIII